MRISDWSSDVCSSDLPEPARRFRHSRRRRRLPPVQHRKAGRRHLSHFDGGRGLWSGRADRKSVVKGKSVSVRVDLGGRSLIKQKKHREHTIKIMKHDSRQNKSTVIISNETTSL